MEDDWYEEDEYKDFCNELDEADETFRLREKHGKLTE